MNPALVILFVIGGIPVAILGFWPWIVNFFSTKLIPWVHEHISTAMADVLGDILIFIDKLILPIRRTIKNLWKYLKDNLLGCNTVYTKTSASTATGKTTTTILDENGGIMRITDTEKLSWDDLPRDIQSEMIRQGAQSAELDQKKNIQAKFQEAAQNQGIALEMTN